MVSAFSANSSATCASRNIAIATSGDRAENGPSIYPPSPIYHMQKAFRKAKSNSDDPPALFTARYPEMSSQNTNTNPDKTLPLLQRSLLVITGKGGVGKTTVAATLALCAANKKRRTILCEVGGQEQARRLLKTQSPHADENIEQEIFQERKITDYLSVITIDPLTAFEEFVGAQLRSRSLVRLLSQSNALKTFIHAAPGAREMLTMMKVWELRSTQRWSKNKDPFDLVILDAPASGHGLGMIRTPTSYAEITRVGPLYNQIVQVREGLADPQATGYVAATLPTELPISETLDLNTWLTTSLRRPLDTVIINGVIRQRATKQQVVQLENLKLRDTNAIAACQALRSLTRRAELQQQQVRRLRRHFTGPTATLPYLFHRQLESADLQKFAENLGRLST